MTVISPYSSLLDRIPAEKHVIDVAGSSTAYREYGGSDARATIVMVHGFRGDHHGLEPVVAHLDGFRIISPDLPGFGESSPLDGHHDIDGYARWLAAFVGALGLEARPVILGHSFGSIVVSATLATTDLAVSDVILVNPIAAPALSGPRGILTRLAVFYYQLAAWLPEKLGFALLRNRMIVRVMSVTMAKTKNVSLRRFIYDQHDRYFSAFSNRAVVLEAFRASVENDVSQYAERISEHTLLIAAEKDDITPVEAQYRLEKLFPDASLRVIPGVGHLIHYETPEPAAGFIREFLGD